MEKRLRKNAEYAKPKVLAESYYDGRYYCHSGLPIGLPCNPPKQGGR